MKPNKIKIEKIKSNINNPRTIKEFKFKQLVNSIKEFPEMLKLRPIVVDEKNIILGGNMRYKAAVEAGMTEVYVIQADNFSEKQKQEFIIKDNLGYGDWDWDILGNEWETKDLDDWGLEIWDNIKETEQDDIYTKNTNIPEYEPKNEKPNENQLYNNQKTKELLDKINKSNATKKEKEFLINAAHRHIVFNYQNIADFYAHSNKEIQELMEDSALIIIDFNKAIKGGYTQMNKELEDLYIQEYGK